MRPELLLVLQDADGIAKVISCQTQGINTGALDSCWCRPDLQPRAETYLSTCVSSSCKSGGGAVTVDVSSAVSIYDNYCLGKGYTANQSPQSVPATTTDAGTAAGTPLVTTKLVTVFSTATLKSTADLSFTAAPSEYLLFLSMAWVSPFTTSPSSMSIAYDNQLLASPVGSTIVVTRIQGK